MLKWCLPNVEPHIGAFSPRYWAQKSARRISAEAAEQSVRRCDAAKQAGSQGVVEQAAAHDTAKQSKRHVKWRSRANNVATATIVHGCRKLLRHVGGRVPPTLSELQCRSLPNILF